MARQAQSWNSLTEEHHQLLAISKPSECTVALYWDVEEERYTKLRFFLGSEFGGYADDEILDTFELLHVNRGMSWP